MTLIRSSQLFAICLAHLVCVCVLVGAQCRARGLAVALLSLPPTSYCCCHGMAHLAVVQCVPPQSRACHSVGVPQQWATVVGHANTARGMLTLFYVVQLTNCVKLLCDHLPTSTVVWAGGSCFVSLCVTAVLIKASKGPKQTIGPIGTSFLPLQAS